MISDLHICIKNETTRANPLFCGSLERRLVMLGAIRGWPLSLATSGSRVDDGAMEMPTFEVGPWSRSADCRMRALRLPLPV